jgi:hypothetical protein
MIPLQFRICSTRSTGSPPAERSNWLDENAPGCAYPESKARLAIRVVHSRGSNEPSFSLCATVGRETKRRRLAFQATVEREAIPRTESLRYDGNDCGIRCARHRHATDPMWRLDGSHSLRTRAAQRVPSRPGSIQHDSGQWAGTTTRRALVWRGSVCAPAVHDRQ